jgi:hypothetical protein
MEDVVFKVLTNNKIYFCEELTNPATSSVRTMMKCFEIFIVNEGWLFYRLKEDCVERGYLDENECLIGPCDDYSQMICMAKIFDGSEPVKYVESLSWIEEEDFHLNRNNGTLLQLIDEICKIDDNNDDSHDLVDNERMSNEYYDNIDNLDPENNNTQNDMKNFEHGYSSEGSSEESSIDNNSYNNSNDNNSYNNSNNNK